MKVPLDADVIHGDGDVQDHVEGGGPTQDTLALMLGLLEGMTQAGT